MTLHDRLSFCRRRGLTRAHAGTFLADQARIAAYVRPELRRSLDRRLGHLPHDVEAVEDDLVFARGERSLLLPPRPFPSSSVEDPIDRFIPELGARRVPRRAIIANRHRFGPAVRQCHRHGMHGTVLLLDSDRTLLVAADLFRGAGLIVHYCDEPARALKQFLDVGADVLVVVSTDHRPSIVREFRGLADDATSIVVASGPENREDARRAGADAFLLNSAPPADLLYEIHRALILRRSGRRLPWNW